MHPICADIEEELERLATEAGHLRNRLERLAGETLRPGSQEEWEATGLCASAAEKIYTGCEKVMSRIAAEVDYSRIENDGAWHKSLLNRMSNPFGDRPAIITADTRQLLDKMRAFRHRARNAYGFDLDSEIVFERASDAIRAHYLLALDVRRFFQA